MTSMITSMQALTKLTATQCQALTGTSCGSGLPKTVADPGTIPSVLTFIFAIIAAISVLMIVIAGLRFVVGGGNPQEMAKARNTIIYAVAGLLIALAAQSIIRLVLNKL